MYYKYYNNTSHSHQMRKYYVSDLYYLFYNNIYVIFNARFTGDGLFLSFFIFC